MAYLALLIFCLGRVPVLLLVLLLPLQFAFFAYPHCLRSPWASAKRNLNGNLCLFSCSVVAAPASPFYGRRCSVALPQAHPLHTAPGSVCACVYVRVRWLRLCALTSSKTSPHSRIIYFVIAASFYLLPFRCLGSVAFDSVPLLSSSGLIAIFQQPMRAIYLVFRF